MPTYYVRTDGSDGNAGTGIASTQAWQTISKALGATGITGGDTVYVAPGVYREAVNITFSSTANTAYIIGDPRAEIFTSISPNPVRITCYNISDSTNSANIAYNISAIGKSNISFKNFWFESFNSAFGLTSCDGFAVDSCLMANRSSYVGSNILLRQDSSVIPHSFNNIIAFGTNFIEYQPLTSGVAISGFLTANNVIFNGGNCFYYAGTAHTLTSPIYVNNCYIHDGGYTFETRGYGLGKVLVQNCVINTSGYYVVQWNFTNHVLFYNCRLCNAGGGVFNGSTPNYSNTIGYIHQGIELGQSLFFGLQYNQMFTNYLNSPNAGMGTNLGIGIGTSDLYGKTWNMPKPDIGAAQYYTGNVSYYYPRDKDFNTTKIAIGSTAQSIFIYLGASGIGHSNTGLVAKYTRNKSNPITFSLASQTITGDWKSGGFVETDPIYQPGLYRLDIPNEAIAPGTDRVVVTVRGTFNTSSQTSTNGNYSFIDLYEPITNSSIANSVWTYGDRTLSATGISARDIWVYDDRTITGGSGVTITQQFPANFENQLITESGRVYLNKADIQKIKT